MARSCGGEWRTARRTVAFEVLQAQASTSLPLKAGWAQQSRDKNDPLYAMRARAKDLAAKR